MNSKKYNEEQKDRIGKALLESIELIQFVKDMSDSREGRGDDSIRTPSKEERMAMLNKFRKPRVRIPDWLKSKFLRIQTIADLTKGLVPDWADDKDDSKTLNINYKGEEHEVNVFFQIENNEIEVYSRNENFIGKKIVFRDRSNHIVGESSFVADDTRSDMKTVVFLSENPVDGLYWAIED